MARKFTPLARITVAAAGTRQAVSASVIYSPSVLITADSTNTGIIYVGDSSVSSTQGEELAAGQSMAIEGEWVGGTQGEVLLSDLYVDASVSGDKVRVSYLARR